MASLGPARKGRDTHRLLQTGENQKVLDILGLGRSQINLEDFPLFSHFWIKIVKIMQPRVALGLTLNISGFTPVKCDSVKSRLHWSSLKV